LAEKCIAVKSSEVLAEIEAFSFELIGKELGNFTKYPIQNYKFFFTHVMNKSWLKQLETATCIIVLAFK